VDYTIKMLEAYCNWLENRVVSWFDRAAAERNLAVMAEVVRIMAGARGWACRWACRWARRAAAFLAMLFLGGQAAAQEMQMHMWRQPAPADICFSP
jgi:hypothetical protein